VQGFGKSVAVKKVVAQHKADAIAADKGFADDECLRDAVRPGLFFIGKLEPELRAVTEQVAEIGKILRRGDDKNIADAGKHQQRQRIIDERFVVYREKLFADSPCYGMKPGAGTAGKYDALHECSLRCLLYSV
jgi:hypothetical protein